MPERWTNLTDAKLLETRLCDLKLRLDDTPLTEPLERLYGELASRGIRFKPHVWLSHGWFSKDGVPGFAVPFYLAHPRLRALEESQMLEVEGGTPDWCMRIFRHEAAHALDTAYALHKRKDYRRHFGAYSKPYPDDYKPRPASRRHVIHLDLWYAQSHPAEDFAETFAVWLRPGDGWKNDYAGWPAMKKLLCVQSMFEQVGKERPKTASRATPKSLARLNMTLAEHYRQKKAFYCRDWPTFYDRDLRRIFPGDATTPRKGAAGEFLKKHRGELRHLVSRWTGESALTIDRTLADMEQRCVQLGLRLGKTAAQTRTDLLLMLAVQTTNHLHDAKHRVPL